MKKPNLLFAAVILASCGSANRNIHSINSDILQQVLESKTYDIPITSIVNADGTKVNLRTNTTLSNAENISGTIGKTAQLDGEYYIRVRPNIIAVNLPYEGKSRSSTLSYNISENYQQNLSTSKMSYVISTKGSNKIVDIVLDEKVNNLKSLEIIIDKNGTASIKASKIADQTVQYDGFIYN